MTMNEIYNIIEIKDLSKKYKDFDLKNVSFNVPKGYIMGFVGQNGAGKTIVMRSLLGMTDYDGECLILGKDARKETGVKENIGVVFDELFFMSHLTPLQVEKQIKGFYSKWDKEKYHRLLKAFKLPEKKKLESFSRGMRMKIMLAVALAHDAEILILDEPTSGLDPVARDEFLDVLYDYISDGEKSVLFSTHITADLEKTADFITMINNGTIIYSGEKDELFEKYAIVKGDSADLNDELREKLIEYSPYRNGFSAMVERKYIGLFSDDFDYEKPALDEILVYMTKERKK